MSELVTTYWPAIVAALLFGLLVAWYLFGAARRTRVTGTTRDVLDDGAAPAERNRALIDAPPAVAPAGLAGAGPAVALAADRAAAQTAAPGDDLTRIKGLGPRIAARLGELGVTTWAQIAAWDEAEAARIDAELGKFSGRMTRDQWVAQARLLAAGDEAGFAARFGREG